MSAMIPSGYLAQQKKEVEVWLSPEVKKPQTLTKRIIPSSLLLFTVVFAMQALTLIFAFYQSLLENL